MMIFRLWQNALLDKVPLPRSDSACSLKLKIKHIDKKEEKPQRQITVIYPEHRPKRSVSALKGCPSRKQQLSGTMFHCQHLSEQRLWVL